MGKELFSCEHIEGGLVFALGDLLLCCITHHGRGCPKVCDFNGGKLPLDKILAFREDVRTQNQSDDRYPLCKGCGFLMKKEWEELAYPFNRLTLAHFTKCNLRCNYCYVIKDGYDKNPYDPYDLCPTLESMIQENRLSPDTEVYWGGGEPTVYKEFEKISGLLLDYGAYQQVASDGLVVSEKLKEALQKGRASLNCSVDAGTAQTYKQIKGRDHFDRVWRNLETYARAAEGSVAAKIILMKENCNEVIPFLEKVQNAGIHDVVYDINFYDPKPSGEIVHAAARLIYECSIKRGLYIKTGWNAISFGEEFSKRVEKSLNDLVVWEEFLEKQKKVEHLQQSLYTAQQSLEQVHVQLRIREEALDHLQQSRAVRFTRELNKHPLLRSVALAGYSFLSKFRRFLKNNAFRSP